jgi:hypothetical protein
MAKNRMTRKCPPDTPIHHSRVEARLLSGSLDEMRRSLWIIMDSALRLLRSRHLGTRDHRLAERIDATAQRLAQLVRDLSWVKHEAGVDLSLAQVVTRWHGGDSRVSETRLGALLTVDLPRRTPATQRGTAGCLRLVAERSEP